MKITFYVAFGLAGLALGGCGYKPLERAVLDGGGRRSRPKLETRDRAHCARRPSRRSDPGAFLCRRAAVAGARAVPER